MERSPVADIKGGDDESDDAVSYPERLTAAPTKIKPGGRHEEGPCKKSQRASHSEQGTAPRKSRVRPEWQESDGGDSAVPGFESRHFDEEVAYRDEEVAYRDEGDAMSIQYMWVAHDPGIWSTLADICWKQDMSTLHNQIEAMNRLHPGSWERRRPKFYLDTDEGRAAARADATGRLRAAAERLAAAAEDAERKK